MNFSCKKNVQQTILCMCHKKSSLFFKSFCPKNIKQYFGYYANCFNNILRKLVTFNTEMKKALFYWFWHSMHKCSKVRYPCSIGRIKTYF